MATGAQLQASAESALQDSHQEQTFEVSGPKLISSNVGATEVKNGKMYMATIGAHFRFPIHPEPNEDHKIAKLLRQYEVIVTTEETDASGKYFRSVLPVTGWIRKECIDDGTLVQVTKETYEQLLDSRPESTTSRCGQCIQNSACLRRCFTSVRKHPVYVMALYLLLEFLAEVVIFADLITDIFVAYTLSTAGKNWLFMLSCVFMLAPYYIAWAAAFGYLQKRAMESTANNEFNNAESGRTDNLASTPKAAAAGDASAPKETVDATAAPKSSSPDKKIQIGVILFAIAPIGVLFLVFLDIYLLFEDFIIKPIFLCLNKSILREESHAERGYKKLRRVSEVVAETICQSVLQLVIIVAYQFPEGSFRRSIDGPFEIRFVYASLVISLCVLVLWGVVLSIEARGFGLHFYEYVTVVLQGSFNFVPYLPAIERGKRERVNWTDFRFDSHSVGLVSKALISPECQLKEIKLSRYSLRKLTRHECKFLGQMLADSPKEAVKVVFSRSRREIEALFNEFDTDRSRSFDFYEFLQLCTALRQNDDGVVSAKDVAEIFAILADEHRHEVYLTDLLFKINRSVFRLPVVDYDSPVMYALKEGDSKLLTFMIAAKVCDDVTWEFYTTTLVTTNRHKDALMMAEERGVPIVVEIVSGKDLPASSEHALDGGGGGGGSSSAPYASVSVSDKVKRTETVPNTVNPEWRQPLLFILPPEDIPDVAAMAAGLAHRRHTKHDADVKQRKNTRTRKQTADGASNGTLHGHGHHHAHGHHHHGGGQQGIVGATSGRLEINFKIYDYDENDDDFFMGSYKHKIKWDLDSLMQHQNGTDAPTILDRKLTNRDSAGSFKFKIYTGTLLYYLQNQAKKSAVAGQEETNENAKTV